MDPKAVINQFNLNSTDSYGFYEHSSFIPDREWEAEENLRLQNFQKVPTYIPKFNDKIKKLIRYGVPLNYRRNFWFQASGAFDYYKTSKVKFNWEKIMTRAMSQPMTNASNFGSSVDILNFLPESNVKQLKIFLHIVWVSNPQIIFAPLIPTVAALLLMYLEPPLAYLTIKAMIDRSAGNGNWYFTVDQKCFYASAESISDQLKRFCSDIDKHATQIGASITKLVMSLFPTFFLPFSTLPAALTFFDSFVLEGRKVLLRFCIGLFSTNRQQLCKSKTPDEFYEIVVNSIRELNTPAKIKSLIKESFVLFISRERHIIPSETAITSDEKPIEELNYFNAYKSYPDFLDKSPAYNSGGIKSWRSSMGIELMSSLSPAKLGKAEEDLDVMSILAKHTPEVLGGNLLANSLYYRLREYLPPSCRCYSPQLVYKLSSDGTMFQTLYSKAEKKKPHLLIVKTDKSLVGAFFDDHPHPGYKGSTTNIVFSCDNYQFYRTARPSNGLYCSCTTSTIMVGGLKASLYFEDGMQKLFSDPSDTFDSPSLLNGDKNNENILDIELYKLFLKT
ncbi:TLD family protein [Trichomonas vaginalis G3]|uniref:TLD family protein n=1 Tax=Trichomonas vaginalis (strain ATCC PRA-98 / G3) TaxID=412133 RepID=A2EEY5_TRIV3|nr:GTPase activator protein [Trichomonas vaginalis G3]EAY08783.1 TLD family protein [Trichomonas vaginalis G3]KAI5515121.1 GTPase activator protein [Trichomonas vaginalis G3]|eukprot:XP_001321006.1 TLD family protein [Trichomonas vaginalis G3]